MKSRGWGEGIRGWQCSTFLNFGDWLTVLIHRLSLCRIVSRYIIKMMRQRWNSYHVYVRKHSKYGKKSWSNTYTVGQVGGKRCCTVVSHLWTKLWNCCQLWPVSFLPNIQSNLDKQGRSFAWLYTCWTNNQSFVEKDSVPWWQFQQSPWIQNPSDMTTGESMMTDFSKAKKKIWKEMSWWMCLKPSGWVISIMDNPHLMEQVDGKIWLQASMLQPHCESENAHVRNVKREKEMCVPHTRTHQLG